MKKFIRLSGFIFALVLSLVLSGCTSAEDAIKLDYEALQVAYPQEKVISLSTSDALGLPTTLTNGSTITWSSSDPNVISNDGVPCADASKELKVDENGKLVLNDTAILTATITNKKDKDLSFTWDVKVQKSKALTSEAKMIFLAYSGLLSEYEGSELTGYKLFFTHGQASPSAYKVNFVNNEKVKLTYTSSNHISFDGYTATVKRPVASEADANGRFIEKVKVNLSYNNVSYDADIPVVLTVDNAAYTTIAKAREEANSADFDITKVYVFPGTITEIRCLPTEKNGKLTGYQSFYIQDGADGFYIYGGTITQKFSKGDLVLITTTITVYNGLLETKKCTAMQLITPASENTEKINALTPVVITKDNYNAKSLLGLDGALCSIDQLIYVSGKMEAGVSAKDLCFLIPGSDVYVNCTVDKNCDDFKAIMETINGLVAGDILKINHAVIGWYDAPQIGIVEASGIEKTKDIVSDTDAVFLASENFVAPLEEVYPGTTNDLPSALAADLSFGTTLSFALGLTQSNKFFNIVDGKLVCGAFTSVQDVTLRVTITKGAVSKVISFKVKATFVSSSIAEVKGMVDASKELSSVVIEGVVADVLGSTVYLTTDGTQFVKINLGSLAAPKAGNTVKYLLQSGVKNSSGVYEFTVQALINNDELVNNSYAGKLTELKDIPLEFSKVLLKNITIASGLANKSDTVIVKFYSDANGTKALTDGTYSYLEGYTVKVSDTEISFIVTKRLDTIAKANELFTKKDTTTVVTLRGTIVMSTGSYGGYLVDDEGNYINVGVKNFWKSFTSARIGVYLELTGTIVEYGGSAELVPTSVSRILTNVIESNISDFIANNFTSITAMPETFEAGQNLTISGFTYVSGVPSKDYTAAAQNIVLKDAAGKEITVYCETFYLTDNDAEAFFKKWSDVVLNPSEYTITISGISAIYNNLNEIKVVYSSLVITKK